MIKPTPKAFKGYFECMVKGGETFFSEEGQKVSDRPRLIFNPSDNLCGFLTYIQYYIFKDIK